MEGRCRRGLHTYFTARGKDINGYLCVLYAPYGTAKRGAEHCPPANKTARFDSESIPDSP